MSRRSRIRGTAAAASGLSTVMRTSSEPARASSATCFAVPAMSAVSVLVIDCTTIGAAPPTVTVPTTTAMFGRRATTSCKGAEDVIGISGSNSRCAWRARRQREMLIDAGRLEHVQVAYLLDPRRQWRPLQVGGQTQFELTRGAIDLGRRQQCVVIQIDVR